MYARHSGSRDVEVIQRVLGVQLDIEGVLVRVKGVTGFLKELLEFFQSSLRGLNEVLMMVYIFLGVLTLLTMVLGFL